MDNKNNWILAGVGILVALQVLSFVLGLVRGGGVGTPNIEDYDPFIKTYGINTAKDITTSGTITGVAGTFSGAVQLTSSFKLGSSGTAQVNQVVTTCSMISNASIAATTTGYGYCTGVTGVTSSDIVQASFSTSTVFYKENWQIVAAKASTTAGAIDFVLMNNTGANAVFSVATNLGSSTAIRAAH